MRENPFFRPSLRLARKNGSENPKPPAWQEDSEILTFEREKITASEGGKCPLYSFQMPLGRSRLPFREAGTRLSGPPDKQFARFRQAFCTLCTSNLRERSKHGGWTELARRTLYPARKCPFRLYFVTTARSLCQRNALLPDFLQAIFASGVHLSKAGMLCAGGMKMRHPRAVFRSTPVLSVIFGGLEFQNVRQAIPTISRRTPAPAAASGG